MAALSFPGSDDKRDVIDVIYNTYCSNKIQGLTAIELQNLYETIRPDGLSCNQIEASLKSVCETSTCDKEDLIDVLQEMDRRYFLVNDLKWEFAMLDRKMKGVISEEDVKFLFKMVHGEFFSSRRWEKFLNSRAAKGSQLSFEEIEVDLCNIPTMGWIEEVIEEEEEERRAREIEREEAERKMRRAEEERRRQDEELKKKKELERKRAEDEKTKKEEEARKKRQAEADEKHRKELEQKKEEERQRKLEEQKKKDQEDQERKKKEEERKRREEEEEQKRQEALLNWKKAELLAKQEADKLKRKEANEEKLRRQQEEAEHAEDIAEYAAAEEERAREAAKKAAAEAKAAKDEETKRKAEEAEKKALAAAHANKEKKLRMQLKAAVKSRKTERIRTSVKDAKAAKMRELQQDIDEAEKVLDHIEAGERLKDAMSRRHLGDVEAAVNNIKKKKLENDYAIELIDADKLMNKLRRLERLRREILELNQSTISEIRSYQNPPAAVHQVMIAVYLLLGYREKELKVWKNMQAFLGRTGKEGLKRQVTQLEPSKVNFDTANYTEKAYLSKHDLDSIRDVSAGAATFYVWSTSMIEEVRAWKEEDQKRKELEQQKKKEMEEEKKKEAERKKAREERKKLGLAVEEPPSRTPSTEDVRAAAEATGLLDAFKSSSGKVQSASKAKTTSSSGQTPPSREATKVNPSRGRATTRTDPKDERSKSQPATKKMSNQNQNKRSATPGRK